MHLCSQNSFENTVILRKHIPSSQRTVISWKCIVYPRKEHNLYSWCMVYWIPRPHGYWWDLNRALAMSYTISVTMSGWEIHVAIVIPRIIPVSIAITWNSGILPSMRWVNMIYRPISIIFYRRRVTINSITLDIHRYWYECWIMDKDTLLKDSLKSILGYRHLLGTVLGTTSLYPENIIHARFGSNCLHCRYEESSLPNFGPFSRFFHGISSFNFLWFLSFFSSDLWFFCRLPLECSGLPSLCPTPSFWWITVKWPVMIMPWHRKCAPIYYSWWQDTIRNNWTR